MSCCRLLLQGLKDVELSYSVGGGPKSMFDSPGPLKCAWDLPSRKYTALMAALDVPSLGRCVECVRSVLGELRARARLKVNADEEQCEGRVTDAMVLACMSAYVNEPVDGDLPLLRCGPCECSPRGSCSCRIGPGKLHVA